MRLSIRNTRQSNLSETLKASVSPRHHLGPVNSWATKGHKKGVQIYTAGQDSLRRGKRAALAPACCDTVNSRNQVSMITCGAIRENLHQLLPTHMVTATVFNQKLSEI